MKKRILSLVLCAAMLLSMCLFLGAGVAEDTTADGSAESTETVVSTSGAPEFQGVGPFITYPSDNTTVQKAPMLRTAANGTSDGASNAVEVKKTAKATGNNDRDGNPIYRIDLNATAKSNIVTKSQPCDIVLVLDRSGSMKGENVTALIKAVNDFLKTVQENSSKSRVAIVSYASVESSHGGAVSVDSGSKSADAGAFVPITQNSAVNSELTSIVKKLADRCDGGTQSGKGLQQAVKIFSDVKETVEDKTVGQKVKNPNYNNTRVTILFTDGQPGNNNNNGYKCSNIFHNHWADKENGYDVAQQSIHWSTILKAPKNGTVKLSADQNFYGNPDGCKYGVSNPDDFHFGQSWNGCGSTVYCVGLNLPSSHEKSLFSETDTATDGSKVNEYLYRVSSHRRDGSHVTPKTIQNDWESGKDWDKTYKDDWTRNREKGYYLVGDQSQLSMIFTKIAEQAGTEVKDVTIRDEISESFVPCDENGNVYQADQTISDNGRIGTVRKDANGGYYIEWTEVTLTPDQIDSAGNVTEAAKTFTGTLYVKPRDGFLGGNNVPTNGENSGVYTADDNPIKPFPQPEVNVPIKLNAQNATKNIYYGNPAPTPEDLTQTADLAEWQKKYVNIKYTVNKNTISNTEDDTYQVTMTVSPKRGGDNADGAVQTVKTKTVTSKVNVYRPEIPFKDSIIDYNATPDYATDNLGKVVWKHEDIAAEPANMTGTEPTLTYAYAPEASAFTQDTGVKVTVSANGEMLPAGVVTFRHDQCTFPGCKYTDDCDYQFYVHINVFDLTIEKKAANGSKIDRNQTFVFRVQGEGVNMQVVITGEAQQTIKNLPVGDYTITEDTSWSWKYKPVDSDTRQLEAESIENGVATVTFENENKGTNWLTSLAKALNVWKNNGATVERDRTN